MSLFLVPNPVWPKIFICPVSWLPWFESKAACQDFLDKNGPRCTVKRIWHCDHCHGYHADTLPPDPAGTTSGTTRTQKHADDPDEYRNRLLWP